MHVYQMRSSNKSVVSATEQRLQVCMNALKEVSKVWLVAKMVHTLFESILGNKLLEERLQKAAGKRHKKAPKMKEDPAAAKRKFDDMDVGFNGPPAPQVSYERSRPQTPSGVQVPSGEPASQPAQSSASQASMPTITSASPHLPRQNTDTFMGGPGNVRGETRPTTPFNPFSYPGTPPDLFLVTRNSPNISHDVWQNFQPDQLFPADTVSFPQISPATQSIVDPQLQRQQSMPQHMPMSAQQMQQNGMQMNQGMTPQGGDQQSWAGSHAEGMTHGSGNEDTWSNSSRGGPIVPTALNVEDW